MLLGPAVDAPLEEWQRMVQVNLLGLLYCAHAALPHLRRAADDGPRRVADMVNISSVAGRVARSGSGVYNATKHGVGAFSEALRQEVTHQHVRVSLAEPGAVETELFGHNRPEIQEALGQRFGEIERRRPADIADAITYIVTRPRRVAINEMLVRPTERKADQPARRMPRRVCPTWTRVPFQPRRPLPRRRPYRRGARPGRRVIGVFPDGGSGGGAAGWMVAPIPVRRV